MTVIVKDGIRDVWMHACMHAWLEREQNIIKLGAQKNAARIHWVSPIEAVHRG